MNKLRSLLKTQLNMNFGISALKYSFKKEKNKRWEPIAILMALLVGICPLIVLYIFLMNSIFNVGSMLGQPDLVLTLAFIAAQTMILIFGLFYIMGSFYFSRDLETLVPLPLKPYEIIGSKFIIVMINEYLTAMPLLIPPIIIFGLGTHQNIIYWFKGILLVLTAPVIPLIISAIFVMLLMRIVNLRRNKDLFTIIGGFVGLFLAIGINMVIQKFAQASGTGHLKNILTSQSGLIEQIGRKFPPSIWATFALADKGIKGWGNLLLFLSVSVVLFFALLWLANLVFYKALIAGQEVTRKRKVMTKGEISKKYGKISNPIISIINREWKLLFRTPIYVINGLTGVFVGPLIIFMMFFVQSSDPDMKKLLGFISNSKYGFYVALGGLGIMLFTAGMNVVASTSVSREGNTFWIAKMIPVSPKRQVMAKFIQGYMVSLIGVLTTCLVLATFFKFPLPRLLWIGALGILTSVSMTALSLMLDVIHPKLVWNSEQEAMKQNMNSLLGMLVSLLIIALLGLCAFLLIHWNISEWMIITAMMILSTVFGVFSLLSLIRIAESRYKSLES